VTSQRLRVEPVGPDQWDHVAALFGPNGATSGCWCMWWRKPNAEWKAGTADGNRDEFQSLIRTAQPVGLLAYATDGSPVGWAAVAPRPAYPRLLRSNTLRLTDPHEPGVWSVPCFFVHRRHRGTGVATALLAGAVGYAASQGAQALEGYPVADDGRKRSNADVYTGTVGMFLDNGFTALPTSAGKPAGKKVIMRRALSG
jgi:GNAT superfamily N-acetyltransferase